MPTELAVTDLVMRAATTDDLPVLAELYLTARSAAQPAMPPLVHPPDDVRRWVNGLLDGAAGERREVWLSEHGHQPVGWMLLEGDWLHSLYVAAPLTGQGIGTALLGVAQGLRPGGFSLWVFESNLAARRFYERHGLVEVERTDGSGNEERSPDVRMTWLGAEAGAGL